MDRAARSMLYFGVLGLLVAGSVIAVLQTTPVIAKEGVVNVYFSSIASDIQNDPVIPDQAAPGGRPQIEIMSLNITIDSVQVHRSGNPSGWTEISRGPITLDLMKPTDVSVLIAIAQVPEQNITMVRMHVTNAVAAVKTDSGMTTRGVEVPSGELKVPAMPLTKVRGQLTTSIIVERPHVFVVQGTGEVKITSVMQVQKVNGPE